MSKKADKKKKDRQKRVIQQKLAAAAKRRELAKGSEDSGKKEGRAQKVMTSAVKQQPQVTSVKPAVVNRRSGG